MIARIYVAFLIVSCTSLLPYNLFMNAHEYFLYKLRNVSDTDNSTGQRVVVQQTALQRNFEGYLTVFGGVACIIGAAINLTFTARFGISLPGPHRLFRLSNTFRIVSGYLLVLASLIPTIVYTYVDTDADQYSFFMISLVLAAAASAGSMGFIAGGVLGLVNTYESCYMQAVLLGQSGAGILSTVLSIVCQALTSDDIMNGRIYFYLAVAWTIGSVYFYVMLVRDSQTRERVITDVDDGRQLIDDDSLEGDRYEEFSPSKKYYAAYLQTRFDLIAISVTLFTTLSAYPAVSSLVRSTKHQNEIWQKYFSSVCCFLIFNTGDAIGRVFGGKVTFTKWQFICLMGLRLVLVPLIAMCNVVPRYHTATFVPYDGVFLFFMVLFALSHGVATATSIGNCAKNAAPELKEIAGSLLNVFCVSSALVGSIFSVFIINLL